MQIYIVKSKRTTLPTTNTGRNIHRETGTHNEKQMDKKIGNQRQHIQVEKPKIHFTNISKIKKYKCDQTKGSCAG